MQWHSKVSNLHIPSSLCHFLHANVLDMVSRQPFQEHFLLLGELNDRVLLSIQGRDEFKDTIREPLHAMLGVDPVVIGLQRRHVRLIGWCHEVDELGPQTRRDRQGWCGRLIDRYELIGHTSLRKYPDPLLEEGVAKHPHRWRLCRWLRFETGSEHVNDLRQGTFTVTRFRSLLS